MRSAFSHGRLTMMLLFKCFAGIISISAIQRVQRNDAKKLLDLQVSRVAHGNGSRKVILSITTVQVRLPSHLYHLRILYVDNQDQDSCRKHTTSIPLKMLALRSLARALPRASARIAPIRAVQRPIAISRSSILSRNIPYKSFSTTRIWKEAAGDCKHRYL